ncbi:hypothetical protein NB636_05665 [Oxalobacter aliiformigenes]|uniref:hypothetical protein n=1 Tax=Oxalobacter aliiformigenes TaxID=2946593 RepID=UPI0022B07AD4|nr:hypothetical protein [Oxalobacter aliiformigenes]MCZ4065215.1 hypothetical protein [Oxalobacter aliiformigenes]WAW00334.1 hypothetical protein NB636_05665 [Oxalobacter aliiformigenes]
MISDNAWGNDPVDISGNIFARSRFRLSGISLRPERRALPGKIVCARFRSAREPDKPFAFLYRYDRQTVQTRAGCRGERRDSDSASPGGRNHQTAEETADKQAGVDMERKNPVATRREKGVV